jgi:predicted MFS family arabinose efflux permease
MNHSSHNIAQKVTVFATYLAFMGMGVVDPILPNIAQHLGATNWQVELLFTAYIFMMALIMIPAGMLASKLGDKKVMALGLAIVATAAFLCSMAQNISSLALFRAVWGYGNAYFFATALILLIALSSDQHKAIGLFEGSIGLGLASGPLVGGFVGQYSWRYPFMVTGSLTLIAFVLVLVFVKEPKEKKSHKPAGFKEIKVLFHDIKFLKISIAAMLYYYGFFVVLAYSPLVIHMNPVEIGLVFFGWGLALALGSMVISTKLEHYWHAKKIIPVNLFCFIVVLILLMQVDSLSLMTALIVLSGLLSGISNSLFTTYVMQSHFERNIVSGGYNFLRWSGAALAPIASGFIGEIFGMKFPYLVAAVLSLISLFLIVNISKKDAAI